MRDKGAYKPWRAHARGAMLFSFRRQRAAGRPADLQAVDLGLCVPLCHTGRCTIIDGERYRTRSRTSLPRHGSWPRNVHAIRKLHHSPIDCDHMKVYFCLQCGAYSTYRASVCPDCQAELPQDSWVEVTEEELRQLEYVEEFDLPPGFPVWEYDVVRLKSDADEGGLAYTNDLLNRMGQKGWELVKITPLGDGDGPRYGVFKRIWAGDHGE